MDYIGVYTRFSKVEGGGGRGLVPTLPVYFVIDIVPPKTEAFLL